MNITTNNLSFKTLQATKIDGVSFVLEAGHKNAIYGPQGSGKKVLLLMLGGYLKPSSGSIYFDDINIYKHLKEHRKHTGLGEMVKVNPLIDELTVSENISFGAKLKGVKDTKAYTKDLLERFSLKTFADTIVKDVSPLARSLLSLVSATIGSHTMIFLDKPTDNLTTSEAKKFWEILNINLSDDIIFFTTRDELEAHREANHVIKLDHKKGSIE